MLELNKWILSAGTLVLFILLSFIVSFVMGKIIKITTKKVSLDNKIAAALKTPIRLIILLSGVFIASYYIKPDFKIDGFNLIMIYKIISIFIVAYVVVSIVKAFFIWYVDNLKLKNKVIIDDTLFQFLTKVITVVLYIIAILTSLSLLQIDIKPILAGLGIAGLAVALALQDTLSNFFSAIYIVVDQPIKIHDYVELPTGEKGYVSEIGWRSTRLTTRDKNIVVIPNSKLSQSVITNYNQIQTKFKVEVPVSVSYKSELDKVEYITVKVAKELMKKIEPTIKDFEPYVRYESFGDSGINFKVSIMSENVENKFVLVHEFIKELNKAYKKNKIEIPYPQRDIHLLKN